MFFVCFGVTLALATLSYGADILAVIPMPSFSHQVAHQPLWRELSLRGHNVTVITTDPVTDSTLTNLTEIDVGFSYKHFNAVDVDVEDRNLGTMWSTLDDFLPIAMQISDDQLSFAAVQNLIRNRRFDVVFVEFFYPEFLGFAELSECPKIVIASLSLSEYLYPKFGNPSHPVLNPDFLTPFYGSLGFLERVISTFFYLRIGYYYLVKNFATKQELIEKHFNVTRNLEELTYDADMVFINTNPLIHGVRALSPNTIEIGGFRGNHKYQNLTQDLKDYLDNAKDGFIYFSLGSNVKSKNLKKKTLEAIISTLKEMPYKILWKFEADELPGKPENVKLIKWAPQPSILAHPNIKLFVTQGGLQSMEEAIYREVPLVVIPFFGDQEQNAKLMQVKGIAIVVNVRPYLDKDKMKNAMLEVINNPRYRNAVRRLKQLVLDTPMSGLEKAVWWTEYVIRNKGAKELRNPSADLPFYQYYLLDVIGFSIFVSAFVVTVSYVSVKLLIRSIYFKLFAHKVSENKKSN